LLDKYKIIKDNIRRYQVYERKTWLDMSYIKIMK
jgi:hypothetical protein